MTLHHAVKNQRVTVQGPAKKPQMDYMSHRADVHPRPSYRHATSCPPILTTPKKKQHGLKGNRHTAAAQVTAPPVHQSQSRELVTPTCESKHGRHNRLPLC